jgi:hypothetical protein
MSQPIHGTALWHPYLLINTTSLGIDSSFMAAEKKQALLQL